jgi:ATP-dependent Lon protease
MGLKTVILPKRNVKDLVDVPKRARNEMHIVAVEHMDQVLNIALAPLPERVKPMRTRKRPAEAEAATKPVTDGSPAEAPDVNRASSLPV